MSRNALLAAVAVIALAGPAAAQNRKSPSNGRRRT